MTDKVGLDVVRELVAYLRTQPEARMLHDLPLVCERAGVDPREARDAIASGTPPDEVWNALLDAALAESEYQDECEVRALERLIDPERP